MEPIYLLYSLKDEIRFLSKKHIFHTGNKIITNCIGVGKRAAKENLEKLFPLRSSPENSAASNHPKKLFLTGFCGALAPDLQTGDIILEEWEEGALLSARMIQKNQELMTINFFKGLNKPENEKIPLLHCHSSVAGSPQEKRKLFHATKTQQIAVDMESQAVIEISRKFKARLTILKVVLDEADFDIRFPAELLFDINQQKVPYIRMLAYIARHPKSIKSLLNLAKRSQKAARRLGEVGAELLETEIS